MSIGYYLWFESSIFQASGFQQGMHIRLISGVIFRTDGWDHMIFLFWTVYVTDHIDRFLNVEPALHTGNKSHLPMVYSYFYTLLDFFASNFWGLCASMFKKKYWSIVFLSCTVFVWLWCYGNANLYRMDSLLWKGLCRNAIISFLSFDRLHQWNHLGLVTSSMEGY